MAAGDVITIIEETDSRKGNYFDGTDDYVLHDAHAIARVLANDTVGTYTAMIYVDDISVAAQTILSAGDNDNTNEYLQLLIDTGRLNIILKQGGAVQFSVLETISSIPERTWTHVAVVQNGTQSVLYVAGEPVATTNTVSTDLTMWYDELALTDKFAIGVLESNATHTNDFKGAIGQVKYFNIDLTAAEIKAEARGTAHTSVNNRDVTIEAARVFDISMEDDGTTDSGSGADNGTFVGNAHYGGEISTWSRAVERNSTGHAAEFINTFPLGNKFASVIKRGD